MGGMIGVKRYIFWQLVGPFAFATAALTGVVWLTQSLRFLDLIINRGLSAVLFFQLAGLLIPKIVTLIIPIAFFLSALFTYHRLKNDSELVVMRTAGLSPWNLASPVVALGAAVALLGYIMNLYVAPTTYHLFKNLQTEVRSQYASTLVEEGTFNTVNRGLTIYVRARESSGDLVGILVYDARTPTRPIAMMAERGALYTTPEGPRFVMLKGNRQQRGEGSDNVSVLYFDRYVLDLSRFESEAPTRWREAGERYLHELINPGTSSDDVANARKFTAEAHQRLTSPLFSIVFALVAATCFLVGAHDRRSDWRRVGLAIVVVIGLETASLGMTGLVAKDASLTSLMYLLVLAPMIGCGWALKPKHRGFPLRVRPAT